MNLVSLCVVGMLEDIYSSNILINIGFLLVGEIRKFLESKFNLLIIGCIK